MVEIRIGKNHEIREIRGKKKIKRSLHKRTYNELFFLIKLGIWGGEIRKIYGWHSKSDNHFGLDRGTTIRVK